MTYLAALLEIAIVTMLAVMIPGPAFFLVSRASAAGSRRVGVATGLGVALATVIWAAAAAFGVAVVMTRFATFYGLLQIAGGVYLIWLGLSAWFGHKAAETASADLAPVTAAENGPDEGPLRRAGLTGLLLTLTNPKVVVFFGSIFVALFPAHTPLWVRIAALGIVAAEELFWYVLVACVFSLAPVQAGYGRMKRALEWTMGAVFIAFGARIVALARI